MKAVLIRHGKTQGNIERRYSGCRTDDPLTEEGINELRRIEELPAELMLFVSPMTRARQTAEIMLPAAEQNVIEDLREMDFGYFEGKSHSELDGDPAYQAWIDSGGTMEIPGAETKEGFTERVMNALNSAAAMASEAGTDNIYIVAHGGTIMAVMAALTGGDYYDFLVPNGTGYSMDLEVDDAGNIALAGAYDRFCGGLLAGSSDR